MFVSRGTDQQIVHLFLAADVDDLKIREQFRKGFAYDFIDRAGALAAAHDQDDRLAFVEAAQFVSGIRIAMQQFLADRRTGQDRFILGDIF